MKNKGNTRSAGTKAKNIHIRQGGRDLTAQAGLIPVVKFFHKHGIVSKTEQSIDHQRGATSLYDAVDMVIFSVVGIIGGARSIRSIVTVWNDRVLSRVAGWLRIPDETTFGRILRTFTQKNIHEMESLNHRIRAGIWRKALRSGTSNVGGLRHLVIDVDSTVKTAYGKQQGVSVGYNPHKRGAASYHPLLAFCAETKEILQGWLRDGSAYTSNGVVEFMRQLLAHLRYLIFAYNMLRWMALCSGNAILRRWEPATMRTYLVRMAGKWTSGARQQKLRVPERTLYHAQWDAWVAVGET